MHKPSDPNPYSVSTRPTRRGLRNYARFEVWIKAGLTVFGVALFGWLLLPIVELIFPSILIVLGVVAAFDNLSNRFVWLPRLIAHVTNDADAHYWLAMRRYDKGDLEAAEESLRKALSREPDHAEAWAGVGWVQYLCDDFEACVESCTRALTRNDQMWEALLGRGMAHHYLGKQEKAVDDLNAAVWLQPESIHTLHGRAVVLQHTRSDAALRDVDAALRIQPKSIPLRTVRIQILIQLNRLADAHLEASETISIAPKDLEVILWNCSTSLQLAEYQQAIKLSTRAIRLSPDDPRPWGFRGRAWIEVKEMISAVQDFERAMSLTPNNPATLGSLGLAKHYAGRSEEGLCDLERAVSLMPEEMQDNLLFNNRGAVRNAVGDYSGAEADYRRAIEIDDSHPNPYKNWAWQLATCPDASFRDGEKAVQFALRALDQCEWQNKNWLPILAAAYAEQGNFEDAAKWQQDSADESSMDRIHLYRKGLPFRDDGQNDLH